MILKDGDPYCFLGEESGLLKAKGRQRAMRSVLGEGAKPKFYRLWMYHHETTLISPLYKRLVYFIVGINFLDRYTCIIHFTR